MSEVYEDPIAPVILEVANLIKSRTRNGQTGMLEGTFNGNTKPTSNEVLKEISDAVDEVRVDLGTEEIPVAVINQVRSLVALAAAIRIEMSYYSEQIEVNKSPYKALEKAYERRLVKVRTAVERALEGDSEDTEVELLPHYSFPDGSNAQGMIGWGTLWG